MSGEETQFGPHPEASSDLLLVARLHFPRVPGTLETGVPTGDRDWGVAGRLGSGSVCVSSALATSLIDGLKHQKYFIMLPEA